MDMDDPIIFTDKIPSSFDPTMVEFLIEHETLFKNAEANGFDVRSIVLLIVLGLLLIFLVGNYVLYTYAQKSLPPRKKKLVSTKKLRREKLKHGVSARGE